MTKDIKLNFDVDPNKVVETPIEMEDTRYTDRFIEYTDKLIQLIQERKIVCRSCNYLVAKPRLQTRAGKIAFAEEAVENIQRKSGYARVLACPNNNESDENYNDIKPGTFILGNFSGFYGIPNEVTKMVTGIADFPKDLLYMLPDTEILFTVENKGEGNHGDNSHQEV